jgi:hypothetical protein
MTHDLWVRKSLGASGLVASGLALSAALLTAGCGGGDGFLAPDVSATQVTQASREQAALNRAMSINAAALAPRVQGERAGSTGSQ